MRSQQKGFGVMVLIIILGALAVAGGGAFYFYSKTGGGVQEEATMQQQVPVNPAATDESMGMPDEPKGGEPGQMNSMMPADEGMGGTMMQSVKEFSMTAYYDAQGKWFSVKEMTVKKGDLVRIKATNTAGMHDVTIDEFKVYKTLPLNQEVTIEFTADKVGDFVYYCSMPGHRAGGQWGTLHVTE
jgi:heme/copper-type cytochrome/quinol oxidase subunit 2